MIKLVFCCRRRPELSREEFQRTWLDRHGPLVRSLRGRARLAVAGFLAGGRAAADAIERRGFDVLSGAPRPRRRDLLRGLVTALR